MTKLSNRKLFVAIMSAGVFLLALAAALKLLGNDLRPPFADDPAQQEAIPLAVLGDSNSHNYHDTLLLPKAAQRGGEWRANTSQWTEILHNLRQSQIAQGEMGVWGTPIKVAEMLDWFYNKTGLGYGGRAPKKRDFRFNFAVSGAECEDLNTGYYRQTTRLLRLMERSPEAWQRGIVVIHIGVNSIGQPPVLERYAQGPLTPELRSRIQGCVDAVRLSVQQIRASHPQTRLVLVGMLNGIHEPGAIHRWQSKLEIDRIVAAVDLFNNGLRGLVADNIPALYFDQDAWFGTLWGRRDSEGKAAYRPVAIDGGMMITPTIGDAPEHAVLGDEHAGTAWNALWAQSLIEQINSSWSLNLAPLSAKEVASALPRKK